MTDLIGVRAVLLFDAEVKTVTDYLQAALDISKRHSRIVGEELELDEFGYRSVHLIARFRGRTMPRYLGLKRPWVEIQVRSLLQHAWAAIGHDHLYKSPITFSDRTKRRFYAIAGGLEIYDQEFDSIRAHRDELHKQWFEALGLGKRFGDDLDITGVSALFEHLYPGSTWSNLPRGRPLLPSIEISLMKCLGRAGISTPRELRRIAQKKQFRRRLQMYASAVGTSPTSVSNFAKSVLAIGERRRDLLLGEYEELVEDPRLHDAISL